MGFIVYELIKEMYIRCMMHGCDQLGILSLDVIVYSGECNNNVINIDD